jgi:1-deoxy-D-xylulose-5-phosphate reductoisomerase
MSNRKTISIFGVTGSIGQSTVDVILAHPDKFEVVAVSAGRNVEGLAQAAIKLGAKFAVIADDAHYEELKALLAQTAIKPLAGEAALLEAAFMPVDLSVMAIVGVAGLTPLMAALPHVKSVAIANKEPLVAAGALVMAEAARYQTKILPLDSEHNAIFQVLETQNKDAVERIILTASGGPFLNWPIEKIKNAKIEEALAHPNWSMGAKISIDSATMMNKALEVIEAHYLFAMPPEKIDVLIHPQSVIHSMVEYADGSVLAQMGASDMRTPIAYALGWPGRLKTPGKSLNFLDIKSLTFDVVDRERFPAISMSYEALKESPAAAIVLNAANEIAVQSFLSKDIGFGDIIRIVRMACDSIKLQKCNDIEAVIDFDKSVRFLTQDLQKTI